MARGTKRHISEQPEAVELQPEQWLCIASLLGGATDEEAGIAAGVSRSTVQRWKLDAAFLAGLNAARREAWACQRERVRALIGRALDVVGGALDSADEKTRLTAAFRVLGSAGELWAELTPTGGVTVAAVEADKWRAALSEL